MYKKFLSLFSLIILVSCSSNDGGSVYPESKKINFVENIHGYEISDSYRWLEDFTSDEQARAAFGDKISHYLNGESLHGNGSTVVDLRVDGGEVLRQGPLKWPPSYC